MNNSRKKHTYASTKGATKNGIKFFKIWLKYSITPKKEKPKMYICQIEKEKRTASQWPFTTLTTEQKKICI